jgi:hypothetical protein
VAAVDEAHGTLSGPATQKILYREFHDYGDSRYERLSAISSAHIYNLRKSRIYRKRRVQYEKTRPVQVTSGSAGPIRRGAPDICVWTRCIRAIWAASDNGSEFINHTVAKLLNKLLIEPKDHARGTQTTTALPKRKNGAVIRKHMGYGHIASVHAEAIETFYELHLNRYLNFHRPCGVPEVRSDVKGKDRRVYRWYATSWEILRQLPGASHLRSGIAASQLERIAASESDTEAAQKMQEANLRLFAGLRRKRMA